MPEPGTGPTAGLGLALFRVTEVEEGRRWRWRVARVPATGHRVEPGTAGRDGAAPGRECRVGFELSPLAAGYAVVCRRALDDPAALLED